MAALTADNPNSVATERTTLNPPLAANAQLFQGAMVQIVLATGLAVNATKNTTTVTVGFARKGVSNVGGLAGAVRGDVDMGKCLLVDNDTVAPVTWAHLHQPCFVVNNNTVGSDDTATVVAGIVEGLEHNDTKVRISFLHQLPAA